MHPSSDDCNETPVSQERKRRRLSMASTYLSTTGENKENINPTNTTAKSITGVSFNAPPLHTIKAKTSINPLHTGLSEPRDNLRKTLKRARGNLQEIVNVNNMFSQPQATMASITCIPGGMVSTAGENKENINPTDMNAQSITHVSFNTPPLQRNPSRTSTNPLHTTSSERRNNLRNTLKRARGNLQDGVNGNNMINPPQPSPNDCPNAQFNTPVSFNYAPHQCPPSSSRTNPLHTRSSERHHNIRNPFKRARTGFQHGANLINMFNSAQPSQHENPNIERSHNHVAPTSTPAMMPSIYPPNSFHHGDSTDDNSNNSDSDNSVENDSDLDDCEIPVALGNPNNQEFLDIGDPVWECQHCGALMWYQERKDKSRHTTVPKFPLCCKGGKIVLDMLQTPPPVLNKLLFHHNHPDAKNFQQSIRTYNAMFSFTSPGMKFDTTHSTGAGPPTLRLHGQTCHRIGSLLPAEGSTPKYAQLYIFDTDNEVDNRMKCFKDNTNIDKNIVTQLKLMLDEYNPHAKAFRMARDMMKQTGYQEVKLKLIADRSEEGRVYNHPTVSEVAALIVGDIDSGSKRDIIVQHRDGKLQRIDEFHKSYLAYQYPLIFPYGEDGYRPNILHKYKHEQLITRKNRQTVKQWLCFRLQERTEEAKTLLHSRRLLQQFLVDGFTMMETERLNWLRKNQSKLRVGKYQKLNDQSQQQHPNQRHKRGRRIVLPSSFVGSKRFMDQLYFDGMAISSALGFPDLFITFTCNPNWPEITRLLSKSNLKPHDRPDIVSKVFKIKFDEMMADLTKRHVLGRVLAFIYTIEFQKRGLPHAHILLFLHPQSKYPTPSDIDNIISAEIPDPQLHPRLYNLVKAHMMHGPCGLARPISTCMKNRKCSKFFPKKYNEETIVDHDGYPVYKRSSKSHSIVKNGITLDNRFVVPYNTRLLLKYQAHINMEWCNQSTSIKYLFKYINKGYDRITASVVPSKSSSSVDPDTVDEIKEYLDCRYVSPSEACWRIFSYKIHGRKPAVERMFYHLIGEKAVYYTDHERMENVLEKASVTESMFSSWLIANGQYEEASQLTYGQFVSKFVYDKKKRTWKPRRKGFTIGRLIWVPPTTGELYYLRMMLTIVKGPKTYEDIRKVGDTQYHSFRDACFAMGFLTDDREYISAIIEASVWGSGHFLRKLFVIMLLSGAVSRPAHLWNETWKCLSDGVLHHQRILANNPELELSEDDVKNLTLTEIEILLQANRRTLGDFKPIPYPDGYVLEQLGNKLIYEERSYNVAVMKSEFQSLYNEQRGIYDEIMMAVENQKGGVFFLHGYGGTGKTYMWKTLATSLRSKHEIVLTVASSGITSLLLPGGRTAHSKFKLPVPTLENSTCNIDYDDDYGELLQQSKLIIWDEAPMASKFCFEALDKTLRDVMSTYGNSEKVFGGKVVVFGGDFRQILPVIPRGSRSDIVHSTINVSYIWETVKVLTLTKNMRLQGGQSDQEKKDIADFSNWLLKLGEGRIAEPNDGYADIEIPKEILIEDFQDPIVAIVESTYPSFLDNYQSYDYLKSRAILASTIDVVDQINNHILNLMPGESKEYYSSNTVDRSEIHDSSVLQVLTPEFLSSLRTSGLPNHQITLKVGCPIMLMRNIDQSEGLCNGTRLIVTKMANHVIEAQIMGGKGHGKLTYIPRMDMSPSQSPWPFKLSRRQFPIIVSYAMTINKSQGQSLDSVGLYIPKDVFSHGQLYVAISRVTSKKGIKILIHDENNKPKSSTANVVYKEVFANI
ncbi:uncharacterized protein LOC131599128 [Vicia villosa]|uniref:uncharacterized protein LOC131599128 n=1 Tax=Vicia villosa TaxID=3911 RepID=UPI00273AE659|nr:uncharacterized protein LOC131599128 [Vicia villosa]